MSINATQPVRKGEELNITPIDSAVKAAIDGLSGTPQVTQYTSGASNLTYALDYPQKRLVLRRPPFGTKPKSGHDMHREYRVMNAIKPVFPAVPKTLFYTDDTSIAGSEFYVMERVEGHLITTRIPKGWNWGEGQGRALCTSFLDRFIDLHAIDFASVGLSDFGRPEGYIARQVGGWNTRYERAWTNNVDKFEDVRDWLDNNQPAVEWKHSILHGDYRIDNCILNVDDPTRIDAILDWEISALGDPLMDLGNMLAYWIQADDPPLMQLMLRQPSTAPGMMTRQEIAAYYAAKTGADISNIGFYYIYGIFRLAVIVQQIYYRYHCGQTDNPRFKNFHQMTNALGNLARAKIKSGTLSTGML